MISNGSVGFIQLDATPTVSQIKFKSDQVFFLDKNNIPQIYFDVAKNKYIFKGTIYADQMEGDVVDSISKTAAGQVWQSSTATRRVLTFNVSPQPFERVVKVDSLFIEGVALNLLELH